MQIQRLSFALLCLLISVISARERIESERGDKALEQFQKVVDIISTLAPIFRRDDDVDDDDDYLSPRFLHEVRNMPMNAVWDERVFGFGDEDEMPYGMPPFRRWDANDDFLYRFPLDSLRPRRSSRPFYPRSLRASSNDEFYFPYGTPFSGPSTHNILPGGRFGPKSGKPQMKIDDIRSFGRYFIFDEDSKRWGHGGRRFRDEDLWPDYSYRRVPTSLTDEDANDDTDMVWQFPTVPERRPRGYPYDE